MRSHGRLHVLSGAALAALGFLASGGPGPAAQAASAAPAPPAVDPALVQADNALGRELFRRLRQGDPGRNLLVSPASAAKALQLTCNGARGATRDGMARALGIQALEPDALNAANRALLAALAPDEENVTLAVANAIWQDGSQVLPAFADLTRNAYGAELGDLSGGLQAVNAWMARTTHGLITRIVDPAQPVEPQALLLANSVYFRATWSAPFDPGLTATAPFTRVDGSQVPCRLMVQTLALDYGEDSHYQAALLPYGKRRYAMLLVLPKPGAALADLEPVLRGRPAGLEPHSVVLRLPRFAAAFSGALDDHLAAMGMALAFDPDRADFSALAPSRHHITSVAHATRISVDERGTVAGAGTVVSMSGTCLPELEMNLDRPFLYAILDRRTSEMIFLGQLGDPSR
jgi:serpin B